MRETLRLGGRTSGELSDDAIAVLHALRDEIDEASVYRGGAAHAGALAGIRERAAMTALKLLQYRGLICVEATDAHSPGAPAN